MRNKLIGLALATAAALLLATGMVSTAPVAAAATSAAQVITVSASSSTSTYATVAAWARQADGRYRRAAVFREVRIGSQGMGSTSESMSRTPTGTFRLSQPFGLKPNPGNTGVPYIQVDRNDIWTGSTGSVIKRAAPMRARHVSVELRELRAAELVPGVLRLRVLHRLQRQPPVRHGRVCRPRVGLLLPRQEHACNRRLRGTGRQPDDLAPPLVEVPELAGRLDRHRHRRLCTHSQQVRVIPRPGDPPRRPAPDAAHPVR